MAQTKVCPICGTTYERRAKECGGTWGNRIACSRECAKVRKKQTMAEWKATPKKVKKHIYPPVGTLRDYEPAPIPEHIRARVTAYKMRGVAI